LIICSINIKYANLLRAEEKQSKHINCYKYEYGAALISIAGAGSAPSGLAYLSFFYPVVVRCSG
jgi:hypothetical protein